MKRLDEIVAAICACIVGYFATSTGDPLAIIAVCILGAYLVKKNI